MAAGNRPGTLGEVVSSRDEQVFVGREAELSGFQQWLSESTPSVLNVTAPGGMGKSALLRAFERVLRDSGLSVVRIDGGAIPPTEEAFLKATGVASVDAAIEKLRLESPVLMIDTFERIAALTPFIQDQLLAAMDPAGRIVIASRFSLVTAWGERSPWSALIRPMPLEPLKQEERVTYLRARGLEGTEAGQTILRVAGGFPLALSVACDLVLKLGVMDLSRAGEWREVIHSLVTQLMSDIEDPGLRDMLEVAAVVRQVERELLSAVLERDDIEGDFERLRALSMIRQGDRGLVLHDEVRRLIREDLRADRPQRYAEIRERAHAHYRRRMREASTADRHHLLQERLYLWEGAITQMMMFSEESPGELWVEVGRSQQRKEIVDLWERWVANVGTQREYAEYPYEDLAANRAMLERMIDHPDPFFEIVRSRDGSARAYGLVIPVCDRVLALFEDDHPITKLIGAWTSHGDRALPQTGDRSTVYYLGAVVDPDASVASLGAAQRDIMRLWVKGGVFLTSTSFPLYKAMLENTGFEKVQGATYEREGLGSLEGYSIEVPEEMVEFWLDAIITGRPVPRPLPRDVAERELQNLLLYWDDDEAVATSAVTPFLISGSDPGADVASTARGRVEAALHDLRSAAVGDRATALDAVRDAYLDPSRASHEHTAEKLGVSRSTFYRLVRRGVSQLAKELVPL